MRVFNQFPQGDMVCKVCGTSADEECVLIPIDGTDEGNICQALPFHVKCLAPDSFRFAKEHNVLYKLIP